MKYIYKDYFSVGGRRFCCNVRNVRNALAVSPTLPEKKIFPICKYRALERYLNQHRNKGIRNARNSYRNISTDIMVVRRKYDSFNNWHTPKC